MSELRLNTDGHIIKFGADNDVSLTHVADTGLLLNSTMQLQFNDASQNINAPSATVLDINATDEIELNATAIDINGTCDISGTFSLGGTNITTTAAELNLIDGGTARGTTALADGDGILINDAGTMRMTNVTAVKTYMSGSNAVTALNNATANELVTVGSTTTELDAETNLTFASNVLTMIRTDDASSTFRFNANRGTGGDALGSVEYQWNGTAVAKIVATAGADTTNKDDANLDFFVTASGESITRAMTIGKDGVIGMGAANVADLGVGLHIRTADAGANITLEGGADDFVIENSQPTGMTILSPNGHSGNINFADHDAASRGIINYDHPSDAMNFYAGGTVHFKIASNGDLTATDTSIGSISDSRVKENIANFTYDLEKFKQLQPRTFDWKNPSQHNGATGNRGFISQEVQAIDDYWVGQTNVDKNNLDYNLFDSKTIANCVFDKDGYLHTSGISESDWEAGKLDGTYPEDSTWASSTEDSRISLTSKLGKKDAMYISVINQLITRIEALEG